MKKYISTYMALMLLLLASTSVLANHHAVKIANKDSIGNYLTDTKGMALYCFKKDGMGKSVCDGGCLEKWPIYYRESIAASPGLDSNDFGFITRDDGQKQTTFRGYPLYYYFKDKAAGDTAGHKVKDIWFVIDPANFPSK